MDIRRVSLCVLLKVLRIVTGDGIGLIEAGDVIGAVFLDYVIVVVLPYVTYADINNILPLVSISLLISEKKEMVWRNQNKAVINREEINIVLI